MKKIAIIVGLGNMGSVQLPLAEFLRQSGVAPLFAVRSHGKYQELIKQSDGFCVRLADREKPHGLITKYSLIPVASASELTVDMPERTAFITSLENLHVIAGDENVDIMAAFTSVGAGNINTVLTMLNDIGKNHAPIMTWLLENLSEEKEEILISNTYSNLIVKNAVIRRTSSNWRAVDNAVCIDTMRNGGSITLEDGNVMFAYNFNFEGVVFKSLSAAEIAKEQDLKFFLTNFVDFVIARYVTLSVSAIQDGEFLFDGENRQFADALIGDILSTKLETELCEMILFIDYELGERFGAKESSLYRIKHMKADTLGRIIKTDKSAHLSKLRFCRQKAAYVSITNPQCKEATVCAAGFGRLCYVLKKTDN